MSDTLTKDRQVIIRGQINTGKTCPPGYDYCWECGYIAPAEEFQKNDRCPNPDCPRPDNWRD